MIFLLKFLSVVVVFASGDVGKIALVNGDVRIAKSESDTGKPAKVSDTFTNDDVIKTGQSGSAKIMFTDDTLIDVGANSSLKVSDYALKDGENRTGTFSLLYGKLRMLVTKKVGDKGRVEVRSVQSVMGVRGTEFVVETPRVEKGAPLPDVSVVVVSGSVQVRSFSGPPVEVRPGQMAISTPKSTASNGVTLASQGGKAESSTRVISVGVDQAQAAVSKVKATDTTFASAVSVSSNSGGQNSATIAAVSNMIQDIKAPPPPSDSGQAVVRPPEFIPNPTTPPVSPLPGGLVHLTVNIQ